MLPEDPIFLRDADPEDTGACVTILRDWINDTDWMPMLHSRPSMMDFWSSRLTQDNAWVVGRDRIEGFAVRSQNFVTALYVTEKYRGQGFGRMLLDHCKTGAGELKLWTFVPNTMAQKFYLREGFRETLRTSGDNEENLPDILYTWRQSA